MLTTTKRNLRNALKFGTTREVNPKEGWQLAELLVVVLKNCSEIGAPQVELKGAMGEALILQNHPQCTRTKLLFDVRINYPFFD